MEMMPTELEIHEYIIRAVAHMRWMCAYHNYGIIIDPTSDLLGKKMYMNGEKKYEVKIQVLRPIEKGGIKIYHFCNPEPLNFCLRIQLANEELFPISEM